MSIIGSNILAGASGQAGYNLNNSLRFRASASAYLARTPAGAGNQKTWTWSAWIKPSRFASQQPLYTSFTSVTNYALLTFSSSGFIDPADTLQFIVTISNAAVLNLQTTQLFRDPSAWYHIVIALDTTQATASNRVKIYVNGNQVTAFGTATYPTQNVDVGLFNTTNAQQIGALASGTYGYFDGYMTEINFVNAQALTPSSFGETSTTTGQWIPKKYTGSYGTNGYYLNFSDASAATAAAIGKDSSGNGNNWTPSGISVTAGVTYDAMLDVPTNTSATVGNYPTLNPLNPFKTYVTLSNANLTATGNSAVNTDTVYSTMGSLSTSIYWEYTCVTVGSSYGRTGAITTFPTAGGGTPGETSLGGFGWRQDGYLTQITNSLVLPTFTTNDVLGYALNPTAGTCALYKNGTLVYTVSGLSTTSTFFPATAEYNGSVGAYNFGQRPFTYTAPSGFVALNTYNLPTPTILQGNKYMDASTWSGSGGASLAITNAGAFKPDFVWGKVRNTTYGHMLFDSVRGAGSLKELGTNTTGAEGYASSNIYGYLSSFNSGGFTVTAGTDATLPNAYWNQSGNTYVGWQWQAGQGTNTSNTSGSITSTVSVNTTAGFSVVTYTGNLTATPSGGNDTVGHGLGVAPKMIIFKRRDGTSPWVVWHTALSGVAYILQLNSTAAQINSATDPSWLGGTPSTPTSTIFGTNYVTGRNVSGQTQVAYCWAEIAGFSKFGSYTGNGSADGPMIFLGFRPKFIITKMTSGADEWITLDSARSDVANANTNDQVLNPYSSAAESSGSAYGNPLAVDFLSNGFKIRGTQNANNNSGSTFIYMAFAANPFKNSNAF